MYGAALSAYKKTSLANVNDQAQAVKLLFDGALKELHLAKDSLDAPLDLGHHIGKAIAIVGELQAGLNFEKGGEAAEFLYSLYAAIIRELSKVSGPEDKNILHLSIRYLTELKKIWEEQVLGVQAGEKPSLAKEKGKVLANIEAHI